MSDFKLDIDYPYEVLKPDNLYTRPNPIKYKLTSIKYRHYGKLMEEMLAKYSSFPEGSDDTVSCLYIISLFLKNIVLTKKVIYSYY